MSRSDPIRRRKTPGAIYGSSSRALGVDTLLEFRIIVPRTRATITKSRMKLLERRFHATMEEALAPVWERPREGLVPVWRRPRCVCK